MKSASKKYLGVSSLGFLQILTNQTTMVSIKLFPIVLLISLFVNVRGYAQSQELRESLFNEADQILQKANEANAKLLSPDNYEEGMKLYQNAAKDLRDGDNIEDIREKLEECIEYFNKAIEATKLAEVTFTNVLAARSDAIDAQAPQYASEIWEDAEEEFKGAALELEGGDVRDAQEEASQAERLYREAELTAIKSNILESARSLILNANDSDVDDYAPKTLEKAKKLITDAEKALENSRYDTDEARNLAKQAEYEANHALYLNQFMEELDREDKTREEVILMAEDVLSRIAGELLINANFDNGYNSVADTIIHKINSLNTSLNRQEQEIESLKQENKSLEAANEELHNKLENLTDERGEISERVESMRRFRQRFDTINDLFTSEEARVIRDGNNAIIRLKGLNFDVGKSELKPEYFGLLTKVKKAINTFPNSKITIEGHTDSMGGDELNMKLSQERANAVKTYLLANMDIEPLRMEAKGYGENNPIANNETEQGRALNRRIDVVIQPDE